MWAWACYCVSAPVVPAANFWVAVAIAEADPGVNAIRWPGNIQAVYHPSHLMITVRLSIRCLPKVALCLVRIYQVVVNANKDRS
jgi:hypothetical protein